LQVLPLRGNVGTRLQKVSAGEVDATLLAAAGLARLGLADRATALLAPEEMLPAVGQGAIGITCRADDAARLALIAGIDDAATRIAVTAERAMLDALNGSCRTPIGGLARFAEDGRLRLDGLVARADGSGVVADHRLGAPGDAARLGTDLGRALKARADPAIFDA
jgi:hydroxymethylbilane synthase